MPELFAQTDSHQACTSNSNYTTCREDAGTGNPTLSHTSNNYAVDTAYHGPPRDFYILRRVFMSFNTTAISSAPSSAQLRVYIPSASHDNINVIVLKSGHNPSVVENYFSTWLTGLGGSLSGWSASDTYVIEYSDEAETTGAGAGYVAIDLNSTALADMSSLDSFKIVIMGYDYDYADSAPPGTGNNLGITYSEYTGTTRDPKIVYVDSAAYSQDVGGVPAANISKIIGIAIADISKVNGV